MGTNALEVYFNNLANSAINNKSVIEKLVANNAKLAATNEDFMAMEKKWPTRLRISKEKPPASIKRAAARHHKERGTQTCSPVVKRKGIMHLMHALN